MSAHVIPIRGERQARRTRMFQSLEMHQGAITEMAGAQNKLIRGYEDIQGLLSRNFWGRLKWLLLGR